MKFKPLIKGALTFIPGAERILPRRGTGGTNSARYCYEVWMKHLTILWENGLQSMPRTLAELGPGDSLGIGLSAMLSGVDHYKALDVVRFSKPGPNLKVFDELVGLFSKRAGRPSLGWPDYDKHLDSKLFPSHILTEERLAASLAAHRLDQIRDAISREGGRGDEISIQYMVPWSSAKIIEPESVDAIVSHSVLEHVQDVGSTYEAMYQWLKPGGVMSHQIDFRSHGVSSEWNGYRAYPEWVWRIIVGRRAFLINREPCSAHVDRIKKLPFELTCHMNRYRSDGIRRGRIAARWKSISDDDLRCCATIIQARKRPKPNSRRT